MRGGEGWVGVRGGMRGRVRGRGRGGGVRGLEGEKGGGGGEKERG